MIIQEYWHTKRILLFAAVIFFSLFSSGSNIIAIITVLGLLWLLIDGAYDEGFGPLAILAGIFAIYIAPRAISILVEESYYFELFSINEYDKEWIFILVIEIILFITGYQYAKNKFIKFVYSPSDSVYKSDRWIVCGAGMLAGLAMVWYVSKMGGLSAILTEYNPERYVEITEDDGISFVKNIAIYFLLGWFIFLSSLFITNGIRPYWYAIFSVLAVFASVLFIKREYLFDIIVVISLTSWLKGYGKNKIILSILAGIAFLVLFSLYLLRSSIYFSDLGSSISDIFNTAEFWVFDQFVLVVQSGEELIGWDYGFRMLFSFVAPFSDFTKYIPIDWELIEKSTGIQKWGIPPTIFGYIYIVSGWLGVFIVAPLFGFFISYINYFILNRININIIWFGVYSVFLIYTWFLFRNGDPAIAVFFTNRILMYTTILYLISYAFRGKISLTLVK